MNTIIYQIDRPDLIPSLANHINAWGWCGRSKSYWWVAVDAGENVSAEGWVAYAGASTWDKNALYFGPTFVKPDYRGFGLQRQLIQVRESFAKESGFTRLLSCVFYENTFSMNNLLKAGFQECKPWVFAGESRCFEKVLHA